MISKYITSEPINLELAIANSCNFKAGALVVFSGLVRNHHEGKAVDYLQYDCQIEMAQAAMDSIVEEACKLWELHYVFCQHRIGKVNLGESAVVVITSASHRSCSYDSNRYIIDKIKAEVPIWKKEFFSDGNVVWV
ncbi:MAG: molybdenum cofactor biosynthesis protein MoaE [Opitutaceae bacterium]|nr:molybdenum cofactor biosynthesis protein MoaE [Cytophagales bacterium]